MWWKLSRVVYGWTTSSVKASLEMSTRELIPLWFVLYAIAVSYGGNIPSVAVVIVVAYINLLQNSP